MMAIEESIKKGKLQELPFYAISTDHYENMLRSCEKEGESINNWSHTISYEEFKAKFEVFPEAQGHFDNGTPLRKLLDDPYFMPDPVNKPRQLSAERLILLGILLCKGDAQKRAEVLWRVVQEGTTPFISAADKDFYPAF